MSCKNIEFTMDLFSILMPNVTDEQREQAYIQATKLLDERLAKIKAEREQQKANESMNVKFGLYPEQYQPTGEVKDTVLDGYTITYSDGRTEVYSEKCSIDQLNVTKGEISFPFDDSADK